MVRRDRASIVLGSPIWPVGNSVADLPDLLTPDDVFEIERISVGDDPLGHCAT